MVANEVIEQALQVAIASLVVGRRTSAQKWDDDRVRSRRKQNMGDVDGIDALTGNRLSPPELLFLLSRFQDLERT